MNDLARKLPLPGAALIAAGLMSGCTTTVPASEDPVLIKLNELETRLVRIERVMDNDSLVALVAQMEQLKEETRQLRGESETIRHEVEGSSTRQRDLYLDVDRRLQTLETGGGSSRSRSPAMGAAGGAAAGAAAAGGAAVAGSDRAAYQAAFDILKDGHYEEAAAQFGQFLATYPDSVLADNAQYWLAETYYVTRDFAQALPAFQAVLDRFPESRKIPDALLKVGFCHYELENWKEARAVLAQVTESHPETTAARLAGQRLARMDTEGR